MKWIRLELAILAWFIKSTKNRRSTTPRERHVALTAIRMSLVDIALALIGVAVESAV